MPLTHFSNGVASFGMPTMGMPGDLMTVGKVFFVNSQHTNAVDGGAGWGESADKPFATIDHAIGQTTANDNDLILVAGEHTESPTAAITLDVDSTWVYGLGWGDQRPTITSSNSTNVFAVSGAGCRLSNMRLVLGAATITHGVNITGAGVIVEGIETITHATSQFTNLITATDAARVKILNCVLNSLDTGAGATSGLNIDGCDDMEIGHCYVRGNFSEHALDNTTAASVDECLRIFVHDCIIINTSDTDTDLAVDMDDSATGVFLRVYTRGGAGTLAGNNDIGACLAFEMYGFDDADETDKTGQLVLPAAAADP